MGRKANRVIVSFLSVILVLILGVVDVTFAADSSASFNITAEVSGAMAINNTEPMTFPTQMTVTTATAFPLSADDPSGTGPAEFDVTGGTPSSGVTVAITPSSVNLACISGACLTNPDEITVDTFTFGGTFSSGTGTLGTAGEATVKVGATEHLDATDKSGQYSGSATFEVTYS